MHFYVAYQRFDIVSGISDEASLPTVTPKTQNGLVLHISLKKIDREREAPSTFDLFVTFSYIL